MPESPVQTLTPSELNRDVRYLLESHYDRVWIEGEVSNFARPSSGHWYFSLKDSSAQVRCALFRNRNQRLRFTPSNGDLVRLSARVSLYENRGEFQLIGEHLEPAGTGQLQARFEALRDRLHAEGLFAMELKQELPASIGHVAVVTSPTGAALQDILQVLARRNPSVTVTVIPTTVQGETAAAELRRALDSANRLSLERPDCDFDAIILARGGGSLEDLWAFNDEALARAIAASHLPVVAGIGHEVDVTIADFAADFRAPTPSAAAEVLSEDRQELISRLDTQRQRLIATMAQRLRREQLKLSTLSVRLRHPGERLREQAQRTDELELRLARAMNLRIASRRRDLTLLETRLRAHSPLPHLRRSRAQVDALRSALNAAIHRQFRLRRERLGHQSSLLENLNPLAILGRGYSILTAANGAIVRAADQVTVGDRLGARLASGRLKLNVEDRS